MNIKNILFIGLLLALSSACAKNSPASTDSKNTFISVIQALPIAAKASLQAHPYIAATAVVMVGFGFGFACHASLTQQTWGQSMVEVLHKCQGAWWLAKKELGLALPLLIKNSLKPKA